MDILPALKKGSLVVVCADHAAREQAARVSAQLALRGPVTVLDGGNRFQAYRVAHLLRRQTVAVSTAALPYFVVLCRSHALAKQALAFVDLILRSELGLSLSPSKTKVVSFLEGFDFLGFHISKRRISIRNKSIEKLKAQVRLLTTRSHNLCSEVFRGLNRVFIGYAHQFAAPFASIADQFRLLDHWVRLRIRSMKFKGISHGYNSRWSNKLIARLGLVSLSGLWT